MKQRLAASVMVAALMAGVATGDGGTVTEAETGKTFQAELSGGEKRTLTCTGTGCREATWLAVDVYAIAHWADGEGLSKSLAKWKGKAAAALQSDQDFYDALCAADIEKRLKMQFVRSVDAEDVRDAYKSSLEKSYGSLPEVAKTFVELFQKDLEDGSTIELRSLPGGTLEVYQNGAALKTFTGDKELCKNVWLIWFQKELADDYLVGVKKGLVGRIDKAWK